MADKNVSVDKSNVHVQQNPPQAQHADTAAPPPADAAAPHHADTSASQPATPTMAQNFFDVQALTAAAKLWVPEAVRTATQKMLDDQRQALEQLAAVQREMAEKFAADQRKMVEQWWAPAKGAMGAVPVAEHLTKIVGDFSARATAAQVQCQQAESELMQQVMTGIDEVAKLSKAGVAWYVSMADQSRAQVAEVVKTAATATTQAAQVA